MKRTFFLLALVAIFFTIKAQNVTPDEARSAAAAFFQLQGTTLTRSATTVSRNGDVALYVFNSPNGYVVVSGDKRTPPILAFSDQGTYDGSTVVPPAQMWLDSYAAQIAEMKLSTPVAADVHPAWEKLLNSRAPMRDGVVIEPLLQSRWGQEEPYNYYCPQDFAGPNGRCVTGCVATALGQIMYYFRYPTSGVGTFTYSHPTYGELSADYESATYDYSAMCDNPSTINTAISKLISDCGIGMDMDYGPNGSGVHNHSAGRVLREHFKYAPIARSIFRDSTDMDWDSLLVTHLERKIPLYYAGWSVPDIDGHGFVCDGLRAVDSSNYYHFNFGWEGSSDGYFYTSALNVGSSHFNLLQEIVADAYPDTNLYQYPEPQPLVGEMTLTSPAGSFTDGSLPHLPYAANMHYTWHIEPDVPNLTHITLNLNFDIAEGDTLMVTSENETPLIITNDSNHSTLYRQTDAITLVFITHNPQQNLGFRASYQSAMTSFCETYTYLSTGTGHFEDGSGDEDYVPLTFCAFKLKATGFPSVNLHFTEFDLEEGHDFLHVFHKDPSQNNWLVSYTGTMPDTTIFFEQRELYFIFETDEWNNAGGFAFDYEGTTSIVENVQTSIQIFPNPASSVLNISSECPITEMTIYNTMGQMVKKQSTADSHLQINVADLPMGLYVVKVSTMEGESVKKFFKK